MLKRWSLVNRWLGPVVCVCLGALLGVALVGTAQAVPDSPYRKLNVFTGVLRYIEQNYVDEVDEDQIIYSAVDGMLTSLDPHSVFMPPDIYEEMKKDTDGKFGGIGVEITEREGIVTVVAPLPETPASRAGLLPGDHIITIDGTATKGISILEAARRMRGKPGTTVVLAVDRVAPAPTRKLQLRLVRERIRIVPVTSFLTTDQIGYARVKTFQKNTARELIRHIERLEHDAGGALQGLVIDLRNNPGGLLDQAVLLVDQFIDEGRIVSTRGRSRRHEEEYEARPGGRTRLPLLVLVNEGSASASEIVAGALQDHGRAVVIGTQTFGKGSVQTVVDLPDGSGLKLTIARYFTPKLRSIHGKGITPDIVVESNLGRAVEGDKAAAKTLPRAGETKTKQPAADPQLETALNHLRSHRIFKRGAR